MRTNLAKDAAERPYADSTDLRSPPPAVAFHFSCAQEKADRLGESPNDAEAFAKEVQRVNREFASSYSLLFGQHRCTCGLACDQL